MPSTHEVTNQVPPLVGHDLADYAPLLEGLEREGAGWAADELHALGRRAGGAEAQEWGRLAEKNRPVLHTHDRYGNRVDEVEFDPAWHELMTVAVEAGLHAAPWADDRAGRPRGACGQGVRLDRHGRRPHLPDLDDLRRRPGAARERRPGRDVRAAADLDRATTSDCGRRPRRAG